MSDKDRMYGASNMKPKVGQRSTKTIKLGKQEHIVMSPQELAQMRRDVEQMKRTIQQLQLEVSTLRNAVRQQANRPTPPSPSMDDFWKGIR